MNISRILGPLPGRREAHAMAWVAIAIGVALCVVSVVLGLWGHSFLGRPLGGDFVEFYTVGHILNHYTPARIYDLRLATALQHASLPAMPETQMLVFGQAPFIAPLFRPFALLPYAWAYVAWLVFSASLYLVSLLLLFRTLKLKAADRATGFLLAISATPFLFETWIGGQVSVVVFFIWALFFWCLETKRRWLAGFVLAMCLFKPTLVALPALMLLIGRRWRVLAGLAGGAVAVAMLSVSTVSIAGCRAWFDALAMNGNLAAGKIGRAGEAWHQAKYVDILAFFHLLLGRWPIAADVCAVAGAAIGTGWLALAWWRSDRSTANRTLWAATLCFMLVVNPYVPIYDSILLICAAALVQSGGETSTGWLLALYLVPWITQSFAEFLHLQLMTLALAGFGIRALKRTPLPSWTQFKLRQEESTMTRPVGLRATGRFQVRSRGLP
jgi:hypothetical protein